MQSDFKQLGFARSVAQVRAIQTLARVLNLFAAKYPTGCSIVLKRGRADGVEVDFAAVDQAAAETGLEEFMELLATTDRLAFLESMVSHLVDCGAPSNLVDPLAKEAYALAAVLYPDAALASGAVDEGS